MVPLEQIVTLAAVSALFQFLNSTEPVLVTVRTPMLTGALITQVPEVTAAVSCATTLTKEPPLWLAFWVAASAPCSVPPTVSASLYAAQGIAVAPFLASLGV